MRHGIRQQGMTLVELMVGMALGLFILVAMLALFTNTGRAASELEKTNGLVENGRYALHLIASDLSLAGHWSGFVPEFDDITFPDAPTDAPTAIPDACLAYSAATWTSSHINNLLGVAIESLDGAMGTCAPAILNHKAGTDVLVTRHANTCLPGSANCEPDSASEVHFANSRCGTQSPQYVMATSGFSTMLQRDCATAVTEKRRFVSDLYYIRDHARIAGDGIPTLMRSSFGLADTQPRRQTATVMIEGIEDLRIEWGIDNLSATGDLVSATDDIAWADPATMTTPSNRGDGAPDTYMRCTTSAPCSAAELSNAVTATVYVLVRSIEQTPGYTDSKTYNLGNTVLGPFNDRFKRRVFQTTVRLANISARRGKP